MSEYTQNYFFTYSPWIAEKWFTDLYSRVSGVTLNSADRCYTLYCFARSCLSLEGIFAECGVYKGGTALIIADVVKGSGKILHLFDSFEGMPENTDPSRHKKGDMGDVSYEDIVNRFANYPFVVINRGFIPDTFEVFKNSYQKFAFVHIDVDIYQTTKDCLEFFYPRLVEGGMMLFDDYGFKNYKLSEKLAVDEFFVGKFEKPISLCTGQCLVIKR